MNSNLNKNLDPVQLEAYISPYLTTSQNHNTNPKGSIQLILSNAQIIVSVTVKRIIHVIGCLFHGDVDIVKNYLNNDRIIEIVREKIAFSNDMTESLNYLKVADKIDQIVNKNQSTRSFLKKIGELFTALSPEYDTRHSELNAQLIRLRVQAEKYMALGENDEMFDYLFSMLNIIYGLRNEQNTLDQNVFVFGGVEEENLMKNEKKLIDFLNKELQALNERMSDPYTNTANEEAIFENRIEEIKENIKFLEDLNKKEREISDLFQSPEDADKLKESIKFLKSKINIIKTGISNHIMLVDDKVKELEMLIEENNELKNGLKAAKIKMH
jgi:hypothetical protein